MKVYAKKSLKSRSMLFRIAVSFLILVTLQGIILSYLFIFSGTLERIDNAAYSIFTNHIGSKKSDVQTSLQQTAYSMISLSGLINSGIYETLVRNETDLSALSTNGEVSDEIMTYALTQLIHFTKYSSVSGAFIIMDDPREVGDRTKPQRISAYVRNKNPESSGSVRNESLILEYGREEYLGNNKIEISSSLAPYMDFPEGAKRDFYFTPVDEALKSSLSATNLRYYGYWSPPFSIKDDSRSAVTYAVPLITGTGTVYGVVGFEIDEACMQAMFPLSGTPYGNGFYLLGVDSDEGYQDENMISSSPSSKNFLMNWDSTIAGNIVSASAKNVLYIINNTQYPNNVQIGSFESLTLYDGYLRLYDEKWQLGYIAPQTVVMTDSNSLKSGIVFALISTVLIGLVLTALVIMFIFKPIRILASKVRLIDPEKPVIIHKTGIREIDDLSGAFEILSDGVSKAAAKMFGIIELVNMPIGSFEINYKDESVHISKSLFGVLGMNSAESANIIFSIEEWYKFIDSFEIVNVIESEGGITETLYTTRGASKKWLRMRKLAGDMRDMGVIIDVTDEISQKQRLEYERNSDPLTKLLNRRAFTDRAHEIIRMNHDKVCILMFADLDGLKSINDLYGHDTGDAYIVAFARFLTRFRELDADVAVGRMSGDEFVLLIGGFDSREEGRAAFDSVFSGLDDYAISAADGSSHTIRASAGIAYYPYDSKDINDLLKFSDYAMYEIKHTKKGEVREFDKDSYDKSAFVSNEVGILNLIFEKRRIRFVFQPIVDVMTGEVFAYEALMRPIIREFKSPDEVLKIARSHSKLYQVEKLTFNVMLDWMDDNQAVIEDKKIFINSMPNQAFTNGDLSEMTEKYSHLYNKIVLDVIENDFSSKEETIKKMESFTRNGSLVAIEDYGTGDSGKLSQFIKPDFVKVDKSIVRGVDNDIDKQRLVQSIVAYSSRRGMKIVAVGIETYEEMETLIRLGADYVQGYYIAMPGDKISDIPANIKDEILVLSSRRSA